MAVAASCLAIIPHVADAQNYPLSDPGNTGGWLPYAALTDEFNGAQLDSTKWEPVSWQGRMPVEHKYENASLSSGELVLTTDLKPGATLPLTESAFGIDAGYIRSVTPLRYGYIEIEAKALAFPIVTTWWMSGGSDTYVREIDMLECPSGVPGKEYDYHYNFHTWKTPTPTGVDSTHVATNPGLIPLGWRMIDDYHVYGFEWDANEMKVYIDGVLQRTHATDTFKVAQSLMIGNEYNSWFTSITDVNNALASLPATYNLRYVRTWVKPDTNVTWYVDSANGNDSNNGLSWVDAKQTIGAAVNGAFRGDQIWVAAGNYQEYLTLNGINNLEIYGGFLSGAVDLNDRDPWINTTTITAPSDGYEVVCIEGADGVRFDGFTLTGVTRAYSSSLKIETPSTNTVIANCRFTGNSPVDGSGGGAIVEVRFLNQTEVQFANCDFDNNQSMGLYAGFPALFLRTGATVDALNCSFYDNSTTGPGGATGMIWVDPSTSMTLTNCIFIHNTSGSGKGTVYSNSGSLNVVNCTVSGNSSHGIHIENWNVNAANIRNSIISENADNGVLSQWAGTLIDSSIFYGNTINGEAGNTVADPLLVNLAGYDVHLLAGSPAIDAADAAYAPATDFDGVARPQGNGSDIGAYEYAAPTGPIQDTANSDIIVSGSVTGSFSDTHFSDNIYQSIAEVSSGGKPSNRYSTLEHKWTANVTGGNSITFYIEAYKTSNSENDDFTFAYSTDDVSYTDIVTISKTSDDNTLQSATLPNTLSGTVYLRVVDTDSTPGNSSIDTLYIDEMYIASDGTPPPNNAPTFTSNPIVELNGIENQSYSASLADDATDADSDPLTFSIVSGPSWLLLASDGSLSGTPGTIDIGLNSFSVLVEDGRGGSDTSTLEITVDEAGSLPPSQATSPSPSDGQNRVRQPVTLSWTAGTGAISHNVYFGSSPGSLTLMGNQTATTYDPGSLAARTTYYWRIDEVNATGTTTGVQWSFKTK